MPYPLVGLSLSHALPKTKSKSFVYVSITCLMEMSSIKELLDRIKNLEDKDLRDEKEIKVPSQLARSMTKKKKRRRLALGYNLRFKPLKI